MHLQWTTPARTTDGVDLKAPVTAEICRVTVAAPLRSQTPRGSQVGRTAGCTVVQKLVVRAGPSEALDTLPATLATGEARLLAYQVQLRGALEKTAGPSTAAYTASGAAPPQVTALQVTDTHTGALLQWKAEPAPSETIELTRTLVSAAKPAAASSSAKESTRSSNPFRPRSQDGEHGTPGVVRMTTGPADGGGALDRAAELGATYEYSAERVLALTFGSRTVEVRSVLSGPVNVTMRDVFPPAAPTGLVATPGPGSIDLSWDPGSEPRIAGYRLYRADSGGTPAAAEWRRVTPELLTMPAYRDMSAAPGQAYSYRVTAVDTTGNESTPSTTATETAPER